MGVSGAVRLFLKKCVITFINVRGLAKEFCELKPPFSALRDVFPIKTFEKKIIFKFFFLFPVGKKLCEFYLRVFFGLEELKKFQQFVPCIKKKLFELKRSPTLTVPDSFVFKKKEKSFRFH